MKIEAKRAFVLADWMKDAQRWESEEGMRALLTVERSRVTNLCESELDQIIGRDKSRLKRFDASLWKLTEVAIAECYVWEAMGSRPWAVGTVKEVGDKFLRMEPTGSRIWKMKLFATTFASEFSLIIFRRGKRFEIDDGSHRAIAMHLAGITKVKAYVGVEN